MVLSVGLNDAAADGRTNTNKPARVCIKREGNGER
jgi:hypothetical protein